MKTCYCRRQHIPVSNGFAYYRAVHWQEFDDNKWVILYIAIL